jgi:hypothetical protein
MGYRCTDVIINRATLGEPLCLITFAPRCHSSILIRVGSPTSLILIVFPLSILYILFCRYVNAALKFFTPFSPCHSYSCLMYICYLVIFLTLFTVCLDVIYLLSSRATLYNTTITNHYQNSLPKRRGRCSSFKLAGGIVVGDAQI